MTRTYVTGEYIYRQTATPSTEGYFRLVMDVLRSSSRTQARLIGADWMYSAEAVKKVLAVPPRELEKVLELRVAR